MRPAGRQASKSCRCCGGDPQQQRRFGDDLEAASKLVNVGQYPRDAALDVSEHAAWTAVANMLLNLDEVLTRE